MARKKPVNDGDIVLIGDSLTEEGRDWGARLGLPHVTNRGISGDNTDGVLQRLGEITTVKLNVIVLLVGANDIFNLHFKQASQQQIPSLNRVAVNVVEIAKALKGISEESTVYVQTLLPTNNRVVNEDINELNTVIRENSSTVGYRVIDLPSEFADGDGLIRSALTSDGTHLAVLGYDLWASSLKTLLEDT
eukprot:gene22616-27297_t